MKTFNRPIDNFYIDELKHEFHSLKIQLAKEREGNSENFARYMEFTKTFLKINKDVMIITSDLSEVLSKNNELEKRLNSMETILDFFVNLLDEKKRMKLEEVKK